MNSEKRTRTGNADEEFYSLMDIIEHYLYCDMYQKEQYKDILFDKELKLTRKLTRNNITHYKGEHIITVIKNINYLKQVLEGVSIFLDIAIAALYGANGAHQFSDYFNSNASSSARSIIQNLISKVIKDANTLPKIIIMKYCTDVLFDKTNQKRQDYKKIYGSYTLSVLFTLFEADKERKKMYKIVSDDNWYSELLNHVSEYFTFAQLTDRRVVSQYKFSSGSEEDKDYQYTCKAIATIYNFFEVRDNQILVKVDKSDDMLDDFLNDSESYSVEHFVINSSAKFLLKHTFPDIEENYYVIPGWVKTYTKSLFNFIFIPKNLNNYLGNLSIRDKLYVLYTLSQFDSPITLADLPNLETGTIALLNVQGVLDGKSPADTVTFINQLIHTPIHCEYSQMVYSKAMTYFIDGVPEKGINPEIKAFPDISADETPENAKIILDSYFQNDFKAAFSAFAQDIIENVTSKFNESA